MISQEIETKKKKKRISRRRTRGCFKEQPRSWKTKTSDRPLEWPFKYQTYCITLILNHRSKMDNQDKVWRSTTRVKLQQPIGGFHLGLPHLIDIFALTKLLIWEIPFYTYDNISDFENLTQRIELDQNRMV